jgi:hypothetical protein
MSHIFHNLKLFAKRFGGSRFHSTSHHAGYDSDDSDRTERLSCSLNEGSRFIENNETALDSKQECGSIVFTKSTEMVECRVFVESRVVTFQSTREDETDNNFQAFAICYVHERVPFPRDHIVIGCMVHYGYFSLILTSFILDFIELDMMMMDSK